MAQITTAAARTPSSETARAGTAQPLKFDVASVRPGRRGLLKGWDFLDPVSREDPPKGGLYSWNVPASFLIYFAYDLQSLPLRMDVGQHLPAWAREPYAVEARANGSPSRDDVRAMVRSLLEERFHFAGHGGTRDGQVNALTMVKPAVGLKPHADGAACEVVPPATTWAYPPYKDVPVHCGVFDRELGKYKRRIELVNVTMQQVADAIGQHSPITVVDATGMTGRYDGFLDYGPDMLPPDADASFEAGLPISAALQQQLGLKLVKQDGKVEYFVVDHIEKPSEN